MSARDCVSGGPRKAKAPRDAKGWPAAVNRPRNQDFSLEIDRVPTVWPVHLVRNCSGGRVEGRWLGIS
jgi:hypothetical protein